MMGITVVDIKYRCLHTKKNWYGPLENSMFHITKSKALGTRKISGENN